MDELEACSNRNNFSGGFFHRQWPSFLVITGLAQNTLGVWEQISANSSFSMKMVLNFVHISSVDLFLVPDAIF